MATITQCKQALEDLASRMRDADEHGATRRSFDRSLSATVPDLGVTFTGALRDGHLVDITTDPAPQAQIRLTAASDDLVALTQGQLNFAQAWVSGRVKVQGGFRDLLKLRSML